MFSYKLFYDSKLETFMDRRFGGNVQHNKSNGAYGRVVM
jgi:hypothetical protein